MTFSYIDYAFLRLGGHGCVKSTYHPHKQAKSLQLCLTLCDLMDGSPPSFSVPGILQARILEWVAISNYLLWMVMGGLKQLIYVKHLGYYL